MFGKINIIFLTLLLTLFSCKREKEKNKLPYLLNNVSEFKEIHLDVESRSDITFNNLTNIEQVNDIYYDYIQNIEVDNKGRIYLARDVIHVYDEFGSLLRNVGQTGRGPGEFLSVHNHRVNNNKLYVFDASQFKISVFSTNDFELVRTIPIGRSDGYVSLGSFNVRSDGSLIVGYRRLSNKTNETRIKPNLETEYFLLDSLGNSSSTPLFKTKTKGIYHVNNENGQRGGYIPYSNETLVSILKDSKTILSWTGEVALKILDDEGNYLTGMYSDIDNVKLNAEELDHPVYEDFKNEAPKFLPAVKSFFIDDSDNFFRRP